MKDEESSQEGYQPNAETLEALAESRSGRNLERFDTVGKLFESWENDDPSSR